MGQTKPINLREGPKNTIMGMEKGWEKLCATLRECDCPNPERFSVFQLYVQLEHLTEKFEAQKPKPTSKNGPK